MAEDASRQPAPEETRGEFTNVAFLESSLADPSNVLRLKLKHISGLPEGMIVRRVLVIMDVLSEEDGRGLDVTWSEGEEEFSLDVQDAVLALLARVQGLILNGSD